MSPPRPDADDAPVTLGSLKKVWPFLVALGIAVAAWTTTQLAVTNHGLRLAATEATVNTLAASVADHERRIKGNEDTSAKASVILEKLDRRSLLAHCRTNPEDDECHQ